MKEALDTLPLAELDELEPSLPPEDLFVEEEAEPEEELKPEASPPRLNEVRQYLAEIGAYSLLTPEEEAFLAAQVQEGRRAAQELSAMTGIPEEEIRHAARVKVLEGHPRAKPDTSPLDRAFPGEVEKACKATPEGRRKQLKNTFVCYLIHPGHPEQGPARNGSP